jgi:type I restriction enzyme S subunit
MDDTFGAERIHLAHRNGSFQEWFPDGDKVEKITKDNYQIVMGDDRIYIMGKCLVTVQGDAEIYVKENAYLLVDKNVEALFHSYLRENFDKQNSEFVSLGSVCKVIAGQSPEGKYYNKAGNGLGFYQGKKDFGPTYINPPTVWTKEITKEALKDDILMSVRAPVGPVNIATERICIGRGLAAIRATDKINHTYLFKYLLKIEKELVGNTGAVFNSINKAQIEKLKIPLPSLSIQKDIVVKINSVQKNIDLAISSYAAKFHELNNLKLSSHQI